jgi:SAM-dependent methyltransferase
MNQNGHLTPKSYWDEVHDRKEDQRLIPRPGVYLLDCELDRVFCRHLAPFAGQTIIEAGCGSSIWLPYFVKKHGMRVTGIDYSAQGIENARRILALHGVQGELIQADFFSRSASESIRGAVLFSLGLVEHFSDTRLVLTALARYLEPNGVMISWLPNTGGRIVRWSCRLNPGLGDGYKTLNLDDLSELHRQCGFQVVEAFYTQFADLTLINLSRYGRRRQKWTSRLFRLISIPLVWVGRWTGFFLRSRVWCSGMVVVARKMDSAR